MVLSGPAALHQKQCGKMQTAEKTGTDYQAPGTQIIELISWMIAKNDMKQNVYNTKCRKGYCNC